MNPSNFLILLSFTAVLIGARLHTEHTLRHLAPDTQSSSDSQEQIKQLTLENEQLRHDNSSLKALLSAEAPVEIPAELVTFVEKDLALNFSTPPLALLANEDQLRDAAGQIWLAAFSEAGLEMRSYAFDMLGINPPNLNFMGQVIAAQTVGAIGIYDHSAGEILLATGFDPENIHHQAALVRLLALALLENAHPLALQLTDDQFHTRQSLHGGRASQIQERFYSLQARHIGFVDQVENTDAVEIFLSLAPYVRDITTFPHTFGTDFLAKLPSKEAVSNALSDDSIPTFNLLFPREIQKTSTFIKDVNLQLDTQLGALTVRSVLSQLETPSTNKLVEHLLSASLTIETNEKQQAITRWSLEWNDKISADTFLAHAQQIASAMEKVPTITQAGNTVTLTVTDGYKVE